MKLHKPRHFNIRNALNQLRESAIKADPTKARDPLLGLVENHLEAIDRANAMHRRAQRAEGELARTKRELEFAEQRILSLWERANRESTACHFLRLATVWGHIPKYAWLSSKARWWRQNVKGFLSK